MVSYLIIYLIISYIVCIWFCKQGLKATKKSDQSVWEEIVSSAFDGTSIYESPQAMGVFAILSPITIIPGRNISRR